MLANWIQLAFPGQTLSHVQVVVIVSASDVRRGCDLQLVHATHFSVLVGLSTHVQINTVWCQVFFPSALGVRLSPLAWLARLCTDQKH